MFHSERWKWVIPSIDNRSMLSQVQNKKGYRPRYERWCIRDIGTMVRFTGARRHP